MTSPTVAVRGSSSREVAPEIAEFTVTVQARDKDRATTLTRLTERVAAVRAILDGYAAAIEKRETSRLSVYAQSKRSGEKVSAYVGAASTSVTVTDLDVVGEMMLRVADQDQVMVNGPYWSVRPASPVYRDARHAAIADAVTRAKEYAEALGARVTGLVELTDVGMSGATPPGRPMFARAMSLAGGAPQQPELDLDPAQQQITAEIEGRFTISEPTILADPLD
ncbi:MAG TPA: SIMPL domain-containing protein [Micromonosporaceae bacterium]